MIIAKEICATLSCECGHVWTMLKDAHQYAIQNIGLLNNAIQKMCPKCGKFFGEIASMRAEPTAPLKLSVKCEKASMLMSTHLKCKKCGLSWSNTEIVTDKIKFGERLRKDKDIGRYCIECREKEAYVVSYEEV